MSASGSCQTAAKDTAEWKQKAGDDRHHFLLQTFASNGKNRQVENLHAEVRAEPAGGSPAAGKTR